MQDGLYLNELESYKMASEEKQKIPNPDKNYYNFEIVNDKEIGSWLKKYVLHIAEVTSVGAMYRYISSYNQICDFFNSNEGIHLMENSREDILKKYKAYLLSQGKPIYKVYTLKHDNKDRVYNPHSYYFLNRFLKFIYKESEDEYILYADDFPEMSNNPANPVKYFNLNKIRQKKMRDEVKEIVIFYTTYKSARTIKSDIYAANKFSEYLAERYPEVSSCSNIKRQHISDYIIFLKMESGYKARTYCSLIGGLKILLADISMIFEYEKKDSFFSYYEYMKKRQAIERTYSKYELDRFNKTLKTMDAQMARCVLLHQLLGTRISDTLLLEQNCLKYKEGNPIILIKQAKTDKVIEKPINEEIVKLVEKSIEYTIAKYGEEKYIFVSNKNPKIPLSYGTLKYWIEEMIRTNNIKDDFGNPLFFSTHVFRRCYGKTLTELHVDDVTIAKLLGHSDVQCVHRYRRMGNKQIAEETKPFRDYMDKVIEKISSEW